MAGTSRRALTIRRMASGLLPCLLGIALLLEAAQAGRTYIYCLATQTVMSGPCCPPSAAKLPDGSSKVAALPLKCCEQRVAQALAPSAPAARSALVLAAPMALSVASPSLSAATERGVTPERATATRTGPPPSRARARLMVFLI